MTTSYTNFQSSPQKELHSIDDLLSEGNHLTASEKKATRTVRLQLWLGLVGVSFLAGIGVVLTTSWKLAQLRDQQSLEKLQLLAQASDSQSPQMVDMLKITLPASIALQITNPQNQYLGKDAHGQDVAQIPGGIYGIEEDDTNKQWVYLLPKAVTGSYMLNLASDHGLELDLNISISNNIQKIDLSETIATESSRMSWELSLDPEIESSVLRKIDFSE